MTKAELQSELDYTRRTLNDLLDALEKAMADSRVNRDLSAPIVVSTAETLGAFRADVWIAAGAAARLSGREFNASLTGN